MNQRIYLLRIRLLNIEPEIWREFVIPADISLDRLHDVVQIIMGWEDRHLYSLSIGKKIYTEKPAAKEDGLECGRYRLVDLVKQKGRTFNYLYDFGDSWEHEIILKDNHCVLPRGSYEIFCLNGARACPPEDVGGIPGYRDFLEAIRDPGHEEHDSYKEWAGGNYDSERFDIDAINFELLRYLRWSRDRLLFWNRYRY